MKWGFLLILAFFVCSCESQEWEDFDEDTDTDTGALDTDTDTGVDTECLDADGCSLSHNPKCRGAGGKWWVRWNVACTCRDGKQEFVYKEDRCEQGCVQNSNAIDWCVEDSPNIDKTEIPRNNIQTIFYIE